MLSLNREHQIVLDFGPDTHRDEEMQVHALHLDCRTVRSHWQVVESLETLRKMMRYLGATDEQMMSFEDSLKAGVKAQCICGCCQPGATCSTSTTRGCERAGSFARPSV